VGRVGRLGVSAALILGSCACIQRNRLNANCEWFSEPERKLDLQRADDRNHLRDDAQLAEALAVRYGDAARTFGPDSLPVVRSKRQERLARLFGRIASHHAVPATSVAEAALRRNVGVDAIVLFLPMVTFLAFVATHLWRRVYADAGGKSWPAPAFMALASLMTSGVVILLGEVWSDVVEMVRVADTHLSMRANRVPWIGHRQTVFISALVLFGAFGWFHLRERERQGP